MFLGWRIRFIIHCNLGNKRNKIYLAFNVLLCFFINNPKWSGNALLGKILKGGGCHKHYIARYIFVSVRLRCTIRTTSLVVHLQRRFCEGFVYLLLELSLWTFRHKNRNLQSTPQFWSKKKKDYRINFKTNYPDIFCFPVGVVCECNCKDHFHSRRKVKISRATGYARSFSPQTFYLSCQRIVPSCTANTQWVPFDTKE